MTDNFFEETNPFVLFERWFADATLKETNDPNAMALSSVDLDGLPNIRVVLLKDWDEQGFVFYTNMESQKGRELKESGKAAANFHWKSLKRQVRIRGLTETVSDEEADRYFSSRHRLSRLGAIASRQSQPLASREVLIAAVQELEKTYSDDAISRPPYWTGIRIKPLYIEFWREGDFRLHDRSVFRRSKLEDSWEQIRLYP